MPPNVCSPANLVRGLPVIMRSIAALVFSIFKALVAIILPYFALGALALVTLAAFLHGNIMMLVPKTSPKWDDNPLTLGLAQVLDVVLLVVATFYIVRFLASGIRNGFTEQQKASIMSIAQFMLLLLCGLGGAAAAISRLAPPPTKPLPVWFVYSGKIWVVAVGCTLVYWFVRSACRAGQKSGG